MPILGSSQKEKAGCLQVCESTCKYSFENIVLRQLEQFLDDGHRHLQPGTDTGIMPDIAPLFLLPARIDQRACQRELRVGDNQMLDQIF